MKYLPYIFLICTMLFSACSVVEDGISDPTDNSNAISFENNFPTSAIDANSLLVGSTSRKWSTVSFKIEGINGAQNCRLDDEIVLNSDYTYSYDGGSMLCGAEDDQKLKSGVWALDTETRTLTFDVGTDHESVLYIESLDEQEVVISTHYYNWKVVGKFAHE